jgi:hypothetical protein
MITQFAAMGTAQAKKNPEMRNPNKDFQGTPLWIAAATPNAQCSKTAAIEQYLLSI